MNSSQVAFPAISSPTHIPLPKPSCSSHIELFLQTQQIFSSLWAFFLALCLAFFLVSADGLVRAWTLETKCLNSHPVSALGMILVLPGVQPEADSETKSQQFIWRFRKYHSGSEEVRKGKQISLIKGMLLNQLLQCMVYILSYRDILRNSEELLPVPSLNKFSHLSSLYLLFAQELCQR